MSVREAQARLDAIVNMGAGDHERIVSVKRRDLAEVLFALKSAQRALMGSLADSPVGAAMTETDSDGEPVGPGTPEDEEVIPAPIYPPPIPRRRPGGRHRRPPNTP